MGAVLAPAGLVQGQGLSIDQMAAYGINRTTADLMRYDFSTDEFTNVAVVTDSSGRTLTGIEASAYIPGHLNIFAFWTDPAIDKTRLVYINTITGEASYVGNDLGADAITGALALQEDGSGAWNTYAVQRVELGLAGGHFDVDTSKSLGTSTDAHVHEYDDKFDVMGIDVFSYQDSKLLEINEVIANSERFDLITVNADLSTAARVSINGQLVAIDPVTSKLGTGSYSLGDTPQTTKLTGLRVDFLKHSIPSGGLVPTETKLVRSNTPGPNGEYRNGAFTIQAVRVNADGSPAYTLGANGAVTSGLLWETTLFWHTKNPSVLDTSTATGRLVRIDPLTNNVTGLMSLVRPYDSLASIDGSGSVFYGTNGSDLYRIDLTDGSEVIVGPADSGMPAMEFAAGTLFGAPQGDTRLRLMDQDNGGDIGTPLNINMSHLGTIVFTPLSKEPRLSSYD